MPYFQKLSKQSMFSISFQFLIFGFWLKINLLFLPLWPFSCCDIDENILRYQVNVTPLLRGEKKSTLNFCIKVCYHLPVTNCMCKLSFGLLYCSVFDAPLYSQLIGDKFPCTVDNELADQISSPTSMSRVSSVGSDIDWKEPSPALYNPRALHSYGPHAVHEAFHLLLTEPSVQKMVVSLSSDKAVWDAVLNNAAVQELRETFYADENTDPLTSESSDETGEETNPALDFVKWIFDNTRARVVEVIETVTKLVSELFKPPADEKTSAGAKDPFEYKLRISFLLSIMVLLIVVVTRAHKA
ncbi:hypothetical protein OIU85_026204 [Salix viminalis]|uniref:Uncharacterized protein n=1 Tax=Salix viminalis TaxID=40686 RepID=A0A9Q0YYD4_SALVM|nr:hypothetical protein OIU85_026204 [Salix viminalis]